MKNLIFIDVDGTLTTQKGDVPQSAKDAIKKAQSHGSLVYLCTGRSLSEITQELKDMDFDGVIAAGGAYIETRDKVLKHERLSKEAVQNFMDYFDSREVGYYLESNAGLFPNEYCIPNIKKSVKHLMSTRPELFVDKKEPEPQWFYDILEESRHKKIPLDNINKLSFISNDHPFVETEAVFKDNFEVYHATVFEFGPESGEIGLKNIDKKTAINELIDSLGGLYKTYAFGDGLNDIAMFEAVDYRVAMENAHDDLKAISNEVTKIAEEDGIYHSFEKNRLL